MSQSPDRPAGATLSDTVARVIEFTAQSGNTIRQGAEIEPVEAEASRNDRSVVVRAATDEILAIEITEPIRVPAAELAALVTEAANEALAAAREQAMEQFAGMPDLAEVQEGLRSLQGEVLDSYRVEMAKLEDFTRGIARD
ncbi:hypothetical protein GCM10028820_20430 [Tessaracoccus terricola]